MATAKGLAREKRATQRHAASSSESSGVFGHIPNRLRADDRLCAGGDRV